MKKCPLCNEEVSHLKKHMKKEHISEARERFLKQRPVLKKPKHKKSSYDVILIEDIEEYTDEVIDSKLQSLANRFRGSPSSREQEILSILEMNLINYAFDYKLVDRDLEKGIINYLKIQEVSQQKKGIINSERSDESDIVDTIRELVTFLTVIEKRPEKLIILCIYRILSSIRFHSDLTEKSCKYINFVKDYIPRLEGLG